MLRLRSPLRTASVLLAALALVPVSSCTFMKLDDFELPPCSRASDCDALNALEHRDPSGSSEYYQCVPGQPEAGCKLRLRDHDEDGFSDLATNAAERDCDDAAASVHPGAMEQCNGIDDDCDGNVDDGATTPPVLLAAGNESPRFVHSVPTDDGASITAYTVDHEAGWLVQPNVISASTDPLQRIGYMHDLEPRMLRTGCARILGDGFTEGVCTMSDVIAAPIDSSRYLVAAINDSGCSRGQLRFGYATTSLSTTTTDPATNLLARWSSGNVGGGYDVASDQCSGASRTSGVRGASSISLATLRTATRQIPQGLAVWIADTLCRGLRRRPGDPVCNTRSTAVQVEAAALALDGRDDAGGTSAMELYTLASAQPMVLGETLSSASPAVTAIDGGRPGYLVAFPHPAAGISLSFVPAPSDPDPPRPFSTRTWEGTRPIALGILDPTAIVSSVVMTVRPVDPTTYTAMLFYHTATDELRVLRATVSVAVTGPAATGTPVTVPSGARGDELSVVYSGGAYWLAWTEPGTNRTLSFARVTDDATPVVGAATAITSGDLHAPTLIATTGGPALTYFDVRASGAGTRGFYGMQHLCVAAP